MGVEADEVTRNVLDFFLGPVLQLLPRPGAQFVEAGRLAVLSLILGYLVEGVDGDEHDVVVLVHQLHHLLGGVAVGDAHQACEAAHAVVGMYHVVAGRELVQLLQRQGNLTATGFVALEVVLMEAVEELVVREDTEAERIVGEAFVQGLLHRGKDDVVAPVLEDGPQAVGLLGAVTTYI